MADLDGRNGFAVYGTDEWLQLGFSVSTAGDVNDDGIDDLLIGGVGIRPYPPYVPGLAGRAVVLFGSSAIGRTGVIPAAFLNGQNGFLILGLWPPDLFGLAVSTTGDANADGVADLVIGAPDADPGGIYNAGQACVFFGHRDLGRSAIVRPSDLDGTNGFILTGTSSSANAGFSVCEAGDLNADGLTDFAVAATGAAPSGRVGAGRAYVIFGSKKIAGPAIRSLANLDGSNGFAIEGILPYDHSGYCIARAGDVNIDGIDDLLIGAPHADPGGRDRAGQAYVVFGAPGLGAGGVLELSSLDGSNGFVINGIGAGEEHGRYVAGVGDINDDGVDDLAVGPYGSPFAHVILGAPDLSASGTIELSSLNGTSGFAVRIADRPAVGVVSGNLDLNADGVTDLVVANPFAEVEGIIQRGKTFVIYGRAGLGAGGYLDARAVSGPDGFTVVGIDLGDLAGSALSGAGDVNADGTDDLAIGAPRRDSNGIDDAGEAYVLFGRRLGDLDLDGDVDLADFLIFQQCYSGKGNPPTPECPTDVVADLDYDGDVDLADFLIFQRNFTGSR